MEIVRSYPSKNFITGMVLSSVTGLALIITSLIMGKVDFFLWLNDDLGPSADRFFELCTNMGDGGVWIIVALLFFAYRKNKMALLIATMIISTVITQGLKNFIIPAQLRPTSAITITENILIHTVNGVELLTNYTFPSGHTATAFSIFLLACAVLNNKWIVPVGFLLGSLVGYSRIYLAQHFPLDVGGGMITAVISVWLSVYVQKRWDDGKGKGVGILNRRIRNKE